jgi:hypothetical protein
MNTSGYPSQVPVWRIFRYLMLRLILGTFRLGWWMLGRSLLFVLGLLRLIASPASSGRAQDEFQDLVQPDSPETRVPGVAGADGFWRMYYQAYSPRLWRMRRLLTMSARKGPKEGNDERDR